MLLFMIFVAPLCYLTDFWRWGNFFYSLLFFFSLSSFSLIAHLHPVVISPITYAAVRRWGLSHKLQGKGAVQPEQAAGLLQALYTRRWVFSPRILSFTVVMFAYAALSLQQQWINGRQMQNSASFNRSSRTVSMCPDKCTFTLPLHEGRKDQSSHISPVHHCCRCRWTISIFIRASNLPTWSYA